MKKRYVTVMVVILVSTLVLVFGSLVVAQGGRDSQPQASSPAAHATNPVSGGDDSNPSGAPAVIIPAKYQVQTDTAAAATTAATTTDVYFTPQDENTSTTILFLYNTRGTAATITLKTYSINGGLTISTAISIPANTLVRLSGDEADTIAPSWQDAILVDFTTHSAYAVMALPAGVKAEGYVAWNNSGNYDPLIPVPTLPLRFSTDTPTIFLPSLPND